jgi:hypothetical protein
MMSMTGLAANPGTAAADVLGRATSCWRKRIPDDLRSQELSATAGCTSIR